MTTTSAVARVAAVFGVAVMLSVAHPRADTAVSVTTMLPEGPVPVERCELFRSDVVEAPPSTSCLRCHDGELASAGSNHPVDVEYERAVTRGRRMGAYRTLEEVVARGILLPDGQIRCATCHDGQSPWLYGLALPAGAELETAAEHRWPRSMRGGDPVAPLPRGRRMVGSEHRTSVEPRPLCIACHAFVD